MGRLPLLIASTVFMSLALAGFGSYAYYMSQTQNLGYPDSAVVGQHDWIPLLCVLVFTTALALGISPISWLLIGELFPLEYRGLGSSISTSFSYFCAFVGIKLFMDFQQVRRGREGRGGREGKGTVGTLKPRRRVGCILVARYIDRSSVISYLAIECIIEIFELFNRVTDLPTFHDHPHYTTTLCGLERCARKFENETTFHTFEF